MLLENFRRSCYGGGNNTAAMPYCVDIAGNASNYSTLSIASNPGTAGYYSTSGYGWYVNVGYGDTAVDKDDYKLADDNIIDTQALTYIGGAVSLTTPSIRTVVTTYRNDSGATVVVKELGLVGKSFNSASATNRNVMIARKVLATPITVPNGVTMSFTYSIDLSFTENTSAS